MDDISVKTCVVCNTEKRVDEFYNKCRECEQCNIKRVLKRYYNNMICYKNVEINKHVLKTCIIN